MNTSSIKIQLNRRNLYIFLFSVMPIIDSINGMLIKLGISFSIGIIYRGIVLLFLLYSCGGHFSIKTVRPGILIAIYFVIASLLHLISGTVINISTELSEAFMWLLFPIIMVFSVYLAKNGVVVYDDFLQVIKNYLIIYPMAILIPRVLGVGFTTYNSGMGFKGFFYATNGVSFVLSMLTIIGAWWFTSKRKLLSGVIYVALIISCVLVGTISCLSSVGISVALIIFQNIKNKSLKQKLYGVLAIVLVLVTGYYILIHYGSHINALLERRKYLQGVYSSNIDFFSSGRTKTAVELIEVYLSSGPLFWLIGLGRGNEIVEMDFIDLIIQYGILGFVLYIPLIKNMIIRKSKKKKVWNFLTYFGIIYAFIVGHVFNNAMSSMMLVIIVCLDYCNNDVLYDKKSINSFLRIAPDMKRVIKQCDNV